MVYYLDTSAWIAWKFEQTGQNLFKRVSLAEDTVVSSTLLAAEYIAFLKRIEKLNVVRFEEELGFISWLYPASPLLDRCLEGVKDTALKGADLYHLATALWFTDGLNDEIEFLSCDIDQRRAAKALGFKVP